MLRLTQAMRLRKSTFLGIVEAHKVIVGVAYLVGYVALDRVSFIEP